MQLEYIQAIGKRLWNGRGITRTRRTADEARRQMVEQLGQVRYVWRQADWTEELGI